MSQPSSNKHIGAVRRSVGRPRRLTIERIVAAARAVGIENLDMVRVAEELAVGVATLYGYVENREVLLRLVAASQLDDVVIHDVGQSWRDAMRAHAAIVFERYTAHPRLLTLLMSGSIGAEAEARYLDSLLAILLDRGLSPEQSIAAYGEATMTAIGAAVGILYQRSVDEPPGGFAVALQHTLEAAGARALSALRRCADARVTTHALTDYSPALERLLADPRWHIVNKKESCS